MIPLKKTMIARARSQWGRYDLPRYISNNPNKSHQNHHFPMVFLWINYWQTSVTSFRFTFQAVEGQILRLRRGSWTKGIFTATNTDSPEVTNKTNVIMYVIYTYTHTIHVLYVFKIKINKADASWSWTPLQLFPPPPSLMDGRIARRPKRWRQRLPQNGHRWWHQR